MSSRNNLRDHHDDNDNDILFFPFQSNRIKRMFLVLFFLTISCLRKTIAHIVNFNLL